MKTMCLVGTSSRLPPKDNHCGGPELDDYQWRLVSKVRSLIEVNYYRNPPRLSLLDAGCDTSGNQLLHLAGLTKGNVVGINVAEDFPLASARAFAQKNVTMMNMDGMNLEFPDHSFDMVVSANVLEHVKDPARYIGECARVLKQSGIAYFETAPLWTSARGHHVHEDMVAENCPEERNYWNDGSVIPDWSHLSLDEDRMRSILREKLSLKACEYILQYLYRSGDLNRAPWSLIRDTLAGTFEHVKITTWGVNDPDTARMSEEVMEDSDVFGFAAVCRKRQPSAISRRLIWRLRKLGI
jgi:SAM-dependent methyltransferase